MANITVSSDVDSMLQSANNAAIRSNIGLSSNPTFTGRVNATAAVETPKVVTNEIQNESGGAINYDSAEHRFRDFDEKPNDLLVIKKINNKSGGRVGINTENGDPKCALHVVQNSSDGYPSNEAIRCTGGLRISNWLRLGPYTDSERDAIGLDPPPGLMIYNEEHYEVQVFIANPSGSGRGSWKAFTLQDVAT